MELVNFLQMVVLWEDDHLMEIQALVSGDDFIGFTQGYDTGLDLLEFAQKLEGFPKYKEAEPLTYNLGEEKFGLCLTLTFEPSDRGLSGSRLI